MSQYDVILHGGRVIDPAQDVDGVFDVAIRDGHIAAVDSTISGTPDTDVIDVSGKLVLPGMIDTHAHVYQHVTGAFGLNADMVGVHSGVTALVDQGGPSCMTLPGFRTFIAEPAQSRVYAFLSAYLVGGLEGHAYPSLYRPDCMNVDATVRVALDNADMVKGIKAHAEPGGFARWGSEVMQQAAQIGEAANLPVYVHFGQLWPLPESGPGDVMPDEILPQVIALLKPGDVLAHPFTRHPGGFVNMDGEVHPIVSEALERGLKVDVGYGSHFSFKMARIAIDAGIVPHTLGADMHGYNTRVPEPEDSQATEHEDHWFYGQTRFSLVSAMTALMALGLTLEQLVPMVTTNATRMLGLEGELGTLKPGAAADVSVLHDDRGQWILRDNEGNEVQTQRRLRPAFCLRAGHRVDADAPILPYA
ncbi:amidohydrolase/deacetylase family metallohydrolase [Candidatus Entotheonella palauensis]|uniref:Dihydroorotase n=1 Tax=Candidatus Entotheonella gemina TaxID=1429439 RepID=W4M3P5_9BACT|nr:amidohydrolase/deacetylase family metallohydrolase [Candidatus Entotheonella palauensis]ETX04586.1 MAG: dihydroorotase [Candidatus Entotheonella gemina]